LTVVDRAGAGYIVTVRRILAVLSILTMGNLVIAQASWSCERNSAATTASASPVDDHAHHGTPAPAQAPGAPAGEGPDHCLTMAHCVIAPALAASTSMSRQQVADERVPMASEPWPRSDRVAPELPPPRA
jgi:hypothetical protein